MVYAFSIFFLFISSTMYGLTFPYITVHVLPFRIQKSAYFLVPIMLTILFHTAIP